VIDNTEADEQGRQHLAVVEPRARFHLALGALRGALEEEPSANAVRSCVRRWIAAATQVADDVIREKQDRRKAGRQ
jgi:hypothetical protein